METWNTDPHDNDDNEAIPVALHASEPTQTDSASLKHI